MNRQAIFSDGSECFIKPSNPKKGDRVSIFLRTERGYQLSANLITRGKSIPMEKDHSDGAFDYYRTDISLEDGTFSYHFKVSDSFETVYYNKMGICGYNDFGCDFTIIPGYSSPEWVKGAVMYQILVDRFCNGDKKNDVESGEYFYIDRQVKAIKDWNAPVEDFDVANFYGGDIKGVMEKLPYLKALGIEAIYFNPLFVSPSNHKYDAQDYDYIDPHYGVVLEDDQRLLAPEDKDNSAAYKYKKRVTDKRNLEASNELFIEFVKQAHENGIKVIIDGVFNHCGSFHKWMDAQGIYKDSPGFAPGAYNTGDSPYRDYFSFEEDSWPENESYKGWWGHKTLPKLNYEGSKDLKDYILALGAKWVSPPYNVDGWRLDVAADLGESEEFNHSFWRQFRQVVKNANPDAVIIAEHYGDASGWLRGDQWDTVMNYDAFMEPVSYFLTGMEKHSDEFEPSAMGDGERFMNVMRSTMAKLPHQALYSAMNQLSNHDHSRFLTRTNHKVGRVAQLGSEAAGEGVSPAIFRQGILMQMTWPGAPTIYYGDEAGVVGFTDPDNRRTYPWDNPDRGLIDFTRDAVYIHRYSKALRRGAFTFLECGRDFVSYARFLEDEIAVIAVNTAEVEAEREIPVWIAGIPRECNIYQIMISYMEGYSIMPLKRRVEKGSLKVKLAPHSAAIYKNNLRG